MLNDASFISEQNALVKFYVKIVMFVAFLSFIVLVPAKSMFFDEQDKVKNYPPLSSEQQRMLIQKLGVSGFKTLIKNNCYKAVEFKIQSGVWDNNWCYNKYRHLKIGE